MSNMMTLSASEFFKKIKHYHPNIDDKFEQSSMIVTKLRAYQRQAIKWMIDKENNNDLVKSDGSPFSGGILADEMGLGKTVEMLSCIMSNKPPSKFYNKKIEISKNDIQNTSTPIKSKQSTSKCVVDEDFIVECYCINAPPRKTLVICAMCGKKQHTECVNFRPNPFQEVPYLCARCWTLNEKMQCRATLIVVPQPILNQWIVEIEKHIAKPDLKVFVYNGVHLDGYIQPISFSDYDIVITSYNILSKDLKYLQNCDLENQNTSRLRHSKKYNYPQSPLPCIKWWRICLDECQAVECGKSKVSEMTLCLKSVHKWAITGTPVQKSLCDLYGILKFLDVGPFSDHEQFLGLLENDTSFVFEWFAKVIWRNSVEDVNVELKLPQVTTENHSLKFSEIEKYYYKRQHDVYADMFSSVVNGLFTTQDILLKHIDKQILYSILEPLYKLQQASIHPQAVYGDFLKVKGTMTMDKLIDEMIKNCRIECDFKLRSLISEHNKIAPLFLVNHEPATAVEHYRNVLHLMELYKEKNLEINICQKIHVMYNLSELLDKYTMISCASSDSDMKNNVELLEKQYLDGHKQNIESTGKIVQKYSDEIGNLIGKKTLSYSNWWSNILELIFSPRDFLIKVKTDLEDYRVPGVPNIGNKLKSLNDVFNILSVWLTNLDSARTKTISTLKKLKKNPMDGLCHSATDSISNQNFLRNWCLLCKAENQLHLYESLLFGISYKHLVNETGEKSYEINMYGRPCEEVWKMSQKEFLLIKVFQYGQAKFLNNKYLKDAAKHMKILDLVREEFKYLKLLWTHLSNNLFAHDEIVMTKQKFQFYFEKSLQPETDCENGPPNKKTKQDKENDEIRENIKFRIMQIESSILTIRAELEKKTGTLLYLENLKKKVNTTETEPCPICTLNIDSEWAVLLCGHSVCDKCLATMCSHSYDLIIACPMCRDETPMYSMSFVKSYQESEVSGIVLQGSFSTKIEKITEKLLELVTQDPNVKVLVFSTWKKALEVLGDALKLNSINYRILKSGNNYEKTLVDFKTNKKINALLMQLSLGAKGLTLTEATHVFFMEPVINKADEHQAIGRIHRIGQTKPTFVHHFIIQDSIEENITNLLSCEQFDKWDDMTLSQMITVFKRSQPNPDV